MGFDPIIDNDDTDAGKLSLIKDLLETNQTGFSDVEREWHDFKSRFDSGADDPRYYDILEERSLRLQNELSAKVGDGVIYGGSVSWR